MFCYITVCETCINTVGRDSVIRTGILFTEGCDHVSKFYFKKMLSMWLLILNTLKVSLDANMKS